MRHHQDANVHDLALKKSPEPSWPYALILDQIKVRQRAKIKSPDLYDTNGFIFPSYDVFEQSSSSACANYKASLIDECDRFVDLTAGCGGDSFAFSRQVKQSILVEREESYAQILSHNAKCLGGNIAVICQDAEIYIKDMPRADLVFIDPQRREKGRKGLYNFFDCSPDILSLLPILSKKTKYVMIKASPLLDIEKGIKMLEFVSQVHVVQWRRECKELLYILDFDTKMHPDDVPIIAVDLGDTGQIRTKFSYSFGQEKNVSPAYVMPQKYIYEPDPAFQKAGGFKSMAVQLGLHKLHPNTHLYTSEEKHEDFPGKYYKVEDIVTVNRKALPIQKADLVLRNFPSTVDALRKKLKLSDGGDYRVFATTLQNDDKKLIICLKL